MKASRRRIEVDAFVDGEDARNLRIDVIGRDAAEGVTADVAESADTAGSVAASTILVVGLITQLAVTCAKAEGLRYSRVAGVFSFWKAARW